MFLRIHSVVTFTVFVLLLYGRSELPVLLFRQLMRKAENSTCVIYGAAVARDSDAGLYPANLPTSPAANHHCLLQKEHQVKITPQCTRSSSSLHEVSCVSVGKEQVHGVAHSILRTGQRMTRRQCVKLISRPTVLKHPVVTL